MSSKERKKKLIFTHDASTSYCDPTTTRVAKHNVGLASHSSFLLQKLRQTLISFYLCNTKNTRGIVTCRVSGIATKKLACVGGMDAELLLAT